MSNLINFDFENQTVRVELKDGEPLFCLTDVATILDIGNANPSRFNLSDDGVHKMYSVDSKGRKNEITFINEPNLYRVIFRSNKKEAVKFQNWVFDEVLPSIRKTGTYALPSTSPLSTVKERNGLVKTCEWFVRAANYLDYSEVYNLVHHRFNVSKLSDLSSEQVPQATEYLQRLLLETIARHRDFGNGEHTPLPPMYRTDIGKYGDDGCLWTRPLEPDEHVVRVGDIPQLLIDEPYISTETLTAINYASSARLASMLKNPPFLTTLDKAKGV